MDFDRKEIGLYLGFEEGKKEIYNVYVLNEQNRSVINAVPDHWLNCVSK